MVFVRFSPRLSGLLTLAVLAFHLPAGAQEAATSSELDILVARVAAAHDVPEELVRKVIQSESGFNPAARNGPFYGLMQIRTGTAKTMGYSGAPEGLFDAETNLEVGVKYLAGAYLVADQDAEQAIKFYRRGYYYDAKRKGLLEETGLKPLPPSPPAAPDTGLAGGLH